MKKRASYKISFQLLVTRFLPTNQHRTFFNRPPQHLDNIWKDEKTQTKRERDITRWIVKDEASRGPE